MRENLQQLITELQVYKDSAQSDSDADDSNTGSNFYSGVKEGLSICIQKLKQLLSNENINDNNHFSGDMKQLLQDLIERMNDRRNYYSAATQVFKSETIKLQSEAKLEECNFCIEEMTKILNTELIPHGTTIQNP